MATPTLGAMPPPEQPPEYPAELHIGPHEAVDTSQAALGATPSAAVTQGADEPAEGTPCVALRAESAPPKSPARGSGEWTGSGSWTQEQVAIPEEERTAVSISSSAFFLLGLHEELQTSSKPL